MIKDKYSWIPKLPEAVLIKKPFYQMSDVEKKIYHLGYEKFMLIADLNTFRNSKVYKYYGDEYVKFPTSKRNVFRPVSKKISLLRLKGIEEELNSLNKERA